MTRAQSSPKASPVRLFKDQDAWAAWLEKNCGKSPGIWLKLAKKNSGLRSVSYLEAVDIALCYGWIDTKSHSNDERSWLQRFVPRSDQSVWSKINCAKALRLIEEGGMRSSGLKAIDRAKANGRWDSAYDPPSRALVPEDLAAALSANIRAKKFFETLDRANRYAILFRIQTAKKPETRAKKIQQFVAMLEQHEKIHA